MSFINTTQGSKVSSTRCDNLASEEVVEVDRYMGVMADFEGLEESKGVSEWKAEMDVRDETKRATSLVKEAEMHQNG